MIPALKHLWNLSNTGKFEIKCPVWQHGPVVLVLSMPFHLVIIYWSFLWQLMCSVCLFLKEDKDITLYILLLVLQINNMFSVFSETVHCWKIWAAVSEFMKPKSTSSLEGIVIQLSSCNLGCEVCSCWHVNKNIK